MGLNSRRRLRVSGEAKLGIIMLGANGRMGQSIIRLLEDSADMELAAAVDKESYKGKIALNAPFFDDIEKAVNHAPDAVIIDFSSPEASMRAASVAATKNVPIVIGTTGLSSQQKLDLEVLAREVPIVCSPNMSVGANVLSDIIPSVVGDLGDAFDMELVEVHHKMKKDSPSGTALMLAEAMARSREWELGQVLNTSRLGVTGPRPQKEIGVQSVRGGDVTGIHTAYFFGPGEYIKIEHVAESTDTFAYGALRAAKWLKGEPPRKLFTMRNVVADGRFIDDRHRRDDDWY